MTPRLTVTFRPAAALALALGVLLTLPGCGNKPADNKDKKDDKDKNTLVTPDNKGTPTPPVTAPPTPAVPEKVDFSTGVGKDAMDFLKSVGEGTAKADQLSADFVKAVGKPVVFDDDKKKGYSAAQAEGWLKRVGASTGFGPAMYSKQAGDSAVIKGGLVGKTGWYSMRMVKEAGAWKVDWLSASSVEVKGTPAPATADALAQEFAVTAVFEAICDKEALGKDERTVAVGGAGLTAALRQSWADPFASDKDHGYDYSPAKLSEKVRDLGQAVESGVVTPAGDATFKVELTKAGGAKATYLVKLAKGTAAGQWLVEAVTPQ